MPKGVSLSAMAKSPDGQGVILFGGMPDDDVEYSTYTAILELRYSSNEWTTLPQKLKNNRFGHVVIPIP